MKLTINPSGFNHDIDPSELGPEVWNFGGNVVFENGFASSTPGWAQIAPGLLCKPLYLLPVFTGLSYWWLYAGVNDAGDAGVIGVTDGVTHHDVTPAAGVGVTKAGDWTGGVLNGVPFLNNGIDVPVYWTTEPTEIMLPLPNWPANTRVAALRPFKYHIVGMNVTDDTGEFPELVIWSDAADPGTIPQEWAPTPDNQAGSFAISTGQGAVIDGGELRDEFIVYKVRSTTVMHYVAGQFVFSNRKAFVTSGILARGCWAEMYGQHYVLTDGDFIRHNGTQLETLIDGINRNWLFDQIDSVNYTSSHIVISHSTNSVWLNFPKSGHEQPDTALVYDIRSEVFGLIDYDEDIAFMTRGVFNIPGKTNDFDGRTDVFDDAPDLFNSSLLNPTSDVLVFCRYEPKKMLAVDGYLREGEPVPVLLQMLSKDMGEPQAMKLITAVWPAGRQGGGSEAGLFRVRVGQQVTLDDPIRWSPAKQIGQFQKAPFLVSGRFISLEYSGLQTTDWQLSSTDIDFELQGQW
jgi:hypothetical protein